MKMVKYNSNEHYIRSDQILRIQSLDSGVIKLYTQDNKELYGDVSVEDIVTQINSTLAKDT